MSNNTVDLNTGAIDVKTDVPHQDFILLAGQRSPGKAVVRGATSKRRWSIQNGYGLEGAGIIYAGATLSEFAVDIFFWEPEQFAEWPAFAKLLERPRLQGKEGRAPRDPGSLAIKHPLLNRPPVSITAVVIGDVTQWEQVDDGLWCCTIPMIAYKKPREVLVRAKEAPPGAKKATPKPQSPEEETIDRMQKENAALAEKYKKIVR